MDFTAVLPTWWKRSSNSNSPVVIIIVLRMEHPGETKAVITIYNARGIKAKKDRNITTEPLKF